MRRWHTQGTRYCMLSDGATTMLVSQLSAAACEHQPCPHRNGQVPLTDAVKPPDFLSYCCPSEAVLLSVFCCAGIHQFPFHTHSEGVTLSWLLSVTNPFVLGTKLHELWVRCSFDRQTHQTTQRGKHQTSHRLKLTGTRKSKQDTRLVQ